MAVANGTQQRHAGAARTFVLALVAGLTSIVFCMSSAAAVATAADPPALRVAGTLNPVSGQRAMSTSATADSVELTQNCVPATIARLQTTQCQVRAVNNSLDDVVLNLATTTSQNLHIVGAAGATLIDARHAQRPAVSLASFKPGVPAVDQGASPAGYAPLDNFGVAPMPIGDEDIINFSVPTFEYSGQTWTSIGVDSNGYIIVGGGSAEDNNCCDLPTTADDARPNNILAPFWTDLDGSSAPGILIATLTDGVDSWIVVEFRLNVFGTNSRRVFQTWIGINGVQDISYAYDPVALPALPGGQPFLVGAENALGQGDMQAVLPTQDQTVSSSAATPGGSAAYTLTARGQKEGTGTVTTEVDGLSQPLVEQTNIQVTPKKP